MNRVLIGVGLVVIFLVTLIMTTPLAYVLKVGQVGTTGLTWSRVHGTIFNGGVENAYFRAQRIGNVRLKLRPAALLRLRVQFDIDVEEGFGDVDGSLYVGLNEIGVRDVKADILLSELVGLKREIRNIGGVVDVSIDDLTFRKRACVTAQGSVKTDALTRFAQQYGRTVSDMTGEFACDGAMLDLPLRANSDRGEEVDARLRVGLAERSTAEASIVTDDTQA